MQVKCLLHHKIYLIVWISDGLEKIYDSENQDLNPFSPGRVLTYSITAIASPFLLYPIIFLNSKVDKLKHRIVYHKQMMLDMRSIICEYYALNSQTFRNIQRST